MLAPISNKDNQIIVELVDELFAYLGAVLWLIPRELGILPEHPASRKLGKGVAQLVQTLKRVPGPLYRDTRTGSYSMSA